MVLPVLGHLADTLKENKALRADVEALVVAAEIALTWFSLHARHSPTCARLKKHIVPDGARNSGLAKDYGGRYATDEERERIPCTCGHDEAQKVLCLALARPGVRKVVDQATSRAAATTGICSGKR